MNRGALAAPVLLIQNYPPPQKLDAQKYDIILI